WVVIFSGGCWSERWRKWGGVRGVVMEMKRETERVKGEAAGVEENKGKRREVGDDSEEE
ncbi:hypothetical protein HAX54_021599, partial [Datura stramonium]|nr:hypothetical protein [Datura stramonium]